MDSRRAIEHLLDARRVAVVGASAEPGKLSHMVLEFLSGSAYGGEVYPVNPRYDAIREYTCYPSVSELPERPDACVVMVPPDAVTRVLSDCGDMNVPVALVMSGGFGEGMNTAEGRQRAEQVQTIAAATGLRIVGPNSVGVVNFRGDLPLTFADWYGRDTGVRGGVAVLAHSGSMGGLVFSLLQQRGIGVNYWVGLGNELDLEACDFIEYFCTDPSVTTLVCYLEGLKDGSRFVSAVEALRRHGKQMIVLKCGRTAVARRATASHTGKLSTAADVYSAVFRDLGVIEVASLRELEHVAYVLAVRDGRRPGSGRIGIMSASGGAGSLLADHAIEHGLEIPDLPEDVQDRLRAVIPEYGAANNPVDLTADVVQRGEILEGAVESVMECDRVGTWVIFGRPIIDRHYDKIAEWARRWPDRFVACSGVPVESSVRGRLEAAGVPVCEDPEACLTGLSQVSRAASVASDESAETQAASASQLAVHRPVSDVVADAVRVHETLLKYGLPVARSWWLASLSEWPALSGDVRFPAAVKSASGAIPHKTEAGCVVLGLETADAAEQAIATVLDNARRVTGEPNQVVQIQEMSPAGEEILLGISQDRDFGAVGTVAFGGVEAELWKDRAIIPPNSRNGAFGHALKELRGWPRLEGFRGSLGRDIAALVATWDALRCLYANESWVAEIECNPVIVLPEGRGACVVDALVTVTGK